MRCASVNVRCNALCPGSVVTPMTMGMKKGKSRPGYDGAMAKHADLSPASVYAGGGCQCDSVPLQATSPSANHRTDNCYRPRRWSVTRWYYWTLFNSFQGLSRNRFDHRICFLRVLYSFKHFRLAHFPSRKFLFGRIFEAEQIFCRCRNRNVFVPAPAGYTAARTRHSFQSGSRFSLPAFASIKIFLHQRDSQHVR